MFEQRWESQSKLENRTRIMKARLGFCDPHGCRNSVLDFSKSVE